MKQPADVVLDLIPILYNGSPSDHMVRSSVIKVGRQFHPYGQFRKGEFFEVDKRDVKARPDIFLAPSGQPYQWVGFDPIDPGAAAVEPTLPEGEQLEALQLVDPMPYDKLIDDLSLIPGIGKSSAAKLIKHHVQTPADLEKLDDSALEEIIGKFAANAYHRGRTKVVSNREPEVSDEQ